MISCCYQCEKRKINCHSACPDYLKEKAEREVEKKEISRKRALDRDFNCIAVDRRMREVRKIHRKEMY